MNMDAKTLFSGVRASFLSFFSDAMLRLNNVVTLSAVAEIRKILTFNVMYMLLVYVHVTCLHLHNSSD